MRPPVPAVFADPGSLGRLRPGPRRPGIDVEDRQRRKLVSSLVHVAAEKGYPATTVGDITARAQVSRRTFYEHFRDKEACLTEAFMTACETLMTFVRDEVDRHRHEPWPQRLAAGIDAYLRGVTYSPDVSRMFFTQHLGAGDDALCRSREVKQRWVDFVTAELDRERAQNPEVARTTAPPHPALAYAGIAGAYEFSLLLLEPGSTLTPADLLEPAMALFLGVNIRAVHTLSRAVVAVLPASVPEPELADVPW
jgi:AcrR family transcriptional regulator